MGVCVCVCVCVCVREREREREMYCVSTRPCTRVQNNVATRVTSNTHPKPLTQLQRALTVALTPFYSVDAWQCTDESPESPEQCLPPPANLGVVNMQVCAYIKARVLVIAFGAEGG